ncbi:MAG TPA: type I DNA topoisomerase [Chloroflexi bacterium]|nr:type I DNA topoisomerase [Chloroflexota bacterium]
MTKSLIIVESAKKAKTIKGMLGPGYTVRATGGHVLEMPRDDIHVDLQTFEPTLYLIRGKGKQLKQLQTAAAKADAIYLATDPDREGEAIARHVVSRLGSSATRKAKRIAFTAITQRDVRAALANPRNIDQNLVEAQTARRVIDRLVGYMVSPVLWAGLSGAKGLSAGRVQSPALWLVVERERVIRAFKPEEWWSVDAELSRQETPSGQRFWAGLIKIQGKKPALKNAQAAETVKKALENADWRVLSVKKGQRLRRPYPPFTTDSLQQAASSQLGMPPKTTMMLAQQLYEGIDVGEGKAVGLITYLRSDSLAVSPEAQQAAREVVTRYWGNDYLPPKPPHYATRDKTAQEAHEAIRPTDPWRTPKKVEPYLSPQQYRLYRLIWRRFIASQMKPARYDTLTVDVDALVGGQSGLYIFRATGSALRFAGFLKVYGVDEDAEVMRQGDKGRGRQGDAKRFLHQQGRKGDKGKAIENLVMPDLKAGDGLNLHQLLPKQHFTKPPARYTEAGLIGELKKRGLGRPSTYAAIIETLKNRQYVIIEKKRMAPTPLGFQVCELLEKLMPDVVDVDFTARMEDNLDAIAGGEISRLKTMQDFYQPFQENVAQAKTRARLQRKPAAGGAASPKRKFTRKGKGKSRKKPRSKKSLPNSEREGQSCPACKEGKLVMRSGKFGAFIACSRFREGCRYTEKL